MRNFLIFIEEKKKVVVFIFFLFYLCLGLFLFDDYGISMDEVKMACNNAKNSAPGPDGLEPGELAMLSDQGFGHVATLMNLIEGGAPWPEGMLQGRVAFL